MLPSLMLWAVACGDGPTVATTPVRTVALVEPWTGWALPMGDGRVIWCDEAVLTVAYPGDVTAEISPSWRIAVRAAGFEEHLDTTAPGLTNVRYVLPPLALNLSVVAVDDRTTVTATLVDAPPADDG